MTALWPDHLSTLADWDARAEDNSRTYELVEGVLVVSPRPTSIHQRVINRLAWQLERQLPLELEPLGEVEVVIDPRPPATVRVPDLCVVSALSEAVARWTPDEVTLIDGARALFEFGGADTDTTFTAQVVADRTAVEQLVRDDAVEVGLVPADPTGWQLIGKTSENAAGAVRRCRTGRLGGHRKGCSAGPDRRGRGLVHRLLPRRLPGAGQPLGSRRFTGHPQRRPPVHRRSLMQTQGRLTMRQALASEE